jgi:hypothetical protein
MDTIRVSIREPEVATVEAARRREAPYIEERRWRRNSVLAFQLGELNFGRARTAFLQEINEVG